jgi:hypothetical protein
MRKDILTAGLVVALFALAASIMAHPQVYSVTPQQGAQGGIGSTPNITIGTVSTRSAGTGATAAITGTTPNLVLSLGIPNGANGISGGAGSAATIAVGTVSSLPTGSTPTITNAGTSSAAVFNFAIPVGLTGSSGNNGTNGTNASNPNFTFPTPTAIGPGGAPTVSVSGTYPNLAITYGLVTGATGSQGPAGVNAIGTGNSRSGAFATAYQATDPTKPAYVTVFYSCTLTAALLSPAASTIELRTGSTNSVATGGGIQADTFSNSLSVSIVLSLGWTGSGTLRAFLPTGYYFAARQTAGTACTFVSVLDQSQG